MGEVRKVIQGEGGEQGDLPGCHSSLVLANTERWSPFKRS